MDDRCRDQRRFHRRIFGVPRHRHPDHERAAEFAANATWFAARAARYAMMFDARTDFFRGREPVSEG